MKIPSPQLGKPQRIAFLSFSAIILVLLILAVAGLYVGQSEWFSQKIRSEIVLQLEQATGGRVETGGFRFHWKRLTAELDRLVIHGKESPDQAPLLSIDRLLVQLRVVSLLRRDVDLASISVQQPRVHLIIYPGGTTNLLEPKVHGTRPVPDTILDLKIGHFEVRDGFVLTEAPDGRRNGFPFETRAENLTTQIRYDPALARYTGDVSIAPLHFFSKETGSLDLRVQTVLSLMRNRLSLANFSIRTDHSRIELANVTVDDFRHPVATADVAARVSIEELGRTVHWKGWETGTAEVRGTARFVSLEDFHMAGKVHCDAFALGLQKPSFDLRNARVDANFALAPEGIEVSGLHVGALGGTVEGNAEIIHWTRFQSQGRMHELTVRALAATSTKYALPYNAIVDGQYQVSGDFLHITDTLVKAQADLSPARDSAPVNGYADLIYDGVTDRVTFQPSYAILPHTRVDASGVLDSRLDIKATSAAPDDLYPFFDISKLPVELNHGSATFAGSIEGKTSDPVIEGSLEAHNVVYEGQGFDSMASHVKVRSDGATLTGSRLSHDAFRAEGEGHVAFNNWRLTEQSSIQGRVHLNDAEIPRLLAVAKQKDVPLTGRLNATGTVSGTVRNPRVVADVRAAKGAFGGEPFDLITAHIDSPSPALQSASGEIRAGSHRAVIHAGFAHGEARILPGTLSFDVETDQVPLRDIATFHQQEPDLNALASMKAEGAVSLSEDATKTLRYRFSKLDGTVDLKRIELSGQVLGDAQMKTVTHNGVMAAHLTSAMMNTPVTGDGTIDLNGDYQLDSRFSIGKLDLNAAWKLLNPQAAAGSFNFGGVMEGNVALKGPLTKADQLTGSAQVTQFELHPLSAGDVPTSLKTFALRNSAPLRASLAKGMVRLDDVRFEGPSTNLAFTGTVNLRQTGALDVRAQGNVNLEILQGFSQDLTSTGALALNATLRGTTSNPDFAGRAELMSGEFHLANLSNGLTNAKGVILFNGTRATVQSLSAESGGGTVDATGFLAVTKGLLAFNLDAKAHQVRVRYPEGVSTVADANVTIAGTSQRSQASGLLRIRRLTVNPKSEATGLLAKSVEPVQTPSANTGLLANLNLDIQIETAPDVVFQTNLAQTIQAEANLRLRGTATNPALLGRITVTEGEIVFFGNKYTVTQGTISFFNPVKLEPILNVDLETKARGVQIIITISGPLDKPLNVTYRSDPPLQFSDIVALLATGRSPTDPSIALRDTTGNQSMQQLGASALLGQAIANPVSGRLQRFFGISKLKIDPALSGITGSPQARLTVEQQVTPDILFTYISDVSSTSTQLIRVEWAFNRTWSAILTREENGYVGLDFAYKKRFK